MRRTLTAGLVLAVVTALIISLGGLFGFGLESFALLGAAIGGALGLVPHPYSWGRIAGFLVGFVAVWIGFALRAAVLPDSSNGRAVAALVVLAIVALACGFSKNRLPLWSALLGVAALVGAYEETYTNAPSQFLSQSPEAATTVLLTVALGYLVTSVIHKLLPSGGDGQDGDEGSAPRHGNPDARSQTSTDELGQLDGLMAGDKK